jgi:glyoxylase-like metal-dependent hydrolase (beta-lactamase superfamily II)
LKKDLIARLGLSCAALSFVAGAALAEDATALLKRASAAMGEPKTLSYTAEGTGYTYGQAFVPGKAWPKINVHSQIRTINYDTGSMREEFTLSRAEPKGGGGYPLSGQQRNDQFVSGDLAWNMAGTNPQPGPRFVTDRVHQLWITPHGVLKAAMANKATLSFESKGGKSLAAVKFTQPGKFVATAYINEAYLVERVESRLPDPVLGEVSATTVYSEYRDIGGIKFPGRVSQSQGGFPTLEVIVTDVKPNAPADIQVPEAVAKASERVTAEKVAEGVWFIAGGSHNSVAIEMKDHMVVVETPLNDGRSGLVLAEVKKLAPGKPVRFVINSHNHFDHAGGIRTAVAEGATIVTQAGNKAYFAKNLAAKSSIAPDMLSKSGKKAKIVTVGDKMDMSDGTRKLELHRIKDGDHNDTFLMVYMPKEKILIEADVFTPGPPGSKPPATPNGNNVALLTNVERLKLDVDKILPLHGRVVPGDDLYAVVGKKR